MIKFLTEKFSRGEFLGEHLWLGHSGHFLIILVFFSALFAALAYAFSIKDQSKEQYWLKIGRSLFVIQLVSLFLIFILLFIMIFNHYFEYYYAWRHSSQSLPLRYLVSCFWEGQEGSFLLWLLWHAVLGVVLIRLNKKVEKGSLFVLNIIQLVLASMLLGVYVFGHKIGINPFALLRQSMEAPIFQRPNYLELVPDGNGLNALLQNYWMVIHPPVLFLGFAAVSIPFSIAMGALIDANKVWVKEALPWSVFALITLGTGIMMGGAWAYESLSFGGFWAWDPVENAVLVPWLLVVAATHMLVARRSTRQSIHLSIIFIMLSFGFIIYSTFLTRSGILGDSSVHSFTDEGLGAQLLVMLVVLIVPFLLLYVVQSFRGKLNDGISEHEPAQSREFWMFVGAAILLFSSAQITATTSIPVWNKIFGTKIAPPTQVEAHYNQYQVWFGIAILLLTAIIQFLNYRSKKLVKSLPLLVSALVSAALTAILCLLLKISYFPYIFFMFAALLGMLANATYVIDKLKKNYILWGGSIAHLGFSLMMVGVLISQYKQEVISTNIEQIDFGKGFDEKDKQDNRLMLLNKGVGMKDYRATYVEQELIHDKTYFKVQFENTKNNKIFQLTPFMQRNGQGNLVSNPDTKHFWNYDLFTNISSYSNTDFSSVEMTNDTIAIGDTIYLSDSYLVLDSLVANPPHDSVQYSKSIIAVGAYLSLHDLEDSKRKILAVYSIDIGNGNRVKSYVERIADKNLLVKLDNVLPEIEKVVISHNSKPVMDDFVILRAIIFPHINLVWFGTLIMVLGGIISIIRRNRERAR